MFILEANCPITIGTTFQYHPFQAKEIESRLQEYINEHPEVVVIDPFENVRKLQRRHESYEIIRDGVDFESLYRLKVVYSRNNGKLANL